MSVFVWIVDVKRASTNVLTRKIAPSQIVALIRTVTASAPK